MNTTLKITTTANTKRLVPTINIYEENGLDHLKVAENRFIIWSYDGRRNGWCATINDACGHQLGEACYAHRKEQAIVDAARCLNAYI